VDILPTSFTYQENFEKSNSDLLFDTVREGNARAIHSIQSVLPLKTGTVQASYGTVNNLDVLTLSWPSKLFVESDTTASAVEARIEMFPDGGIFANVPSIGDCVVLLSQEEVEAVRSNALGALPAIRNGIDRTPTNRCEQVLSSMLHILSSREDSTGFRGLPIDVFFNPEDDGTDNASDSASPLKFTGWPNPSRMRDLRGPKSSSSAQQQAPSLQAPYLPNHSDDFNPGPPSCSEEAALEEYTRNSQVHATFTVGPFRDDIAVVRDYCEIEEIELLNKVAGGRGRAYSWFKAIKRFIIKLVQ